VNQGNWLLGVRPSRGGGKDYRRPSLNKGESRKNDQRIEKGYEGQSGVDLSGVQGIDQNSQGYKGTLTKKENKSGPPHQTARQG